MIVIIGVNVVVYGVCKYARRFNPSLIHIKGVGFAKIWGAFCEFDVHGVQIGCAKILGLFHKIAIYRACVNFVKI